MSTIKRNKKPLIYLAIYIATILAFTLIYRYVGGFYAPYSRFEPFASDDTRALEQVLKDAATAAVKNPMRKVISADDWVLDRDSIDIKDVEILQDGNVSFKTSFIMTNQKSKFTPTYSVHMSHTPDFTFCDDSGKCDTYNHFIHLPKKYSETYYLDLERRAFNVVFANYRKDGFISGGISLSDEQEHKMSSLYSGIQGDPSGISGNTWRMAYLSVVVITTLGFGDIIPITPVARLLVATESILGVLIAGLFLNSITSRKRA